MNKFLPVIIAMSLLTLMGCSPFTEKAAELATGPWRFVLQLKPDVPMPFSAEITLEDGRYQMVILNAEEELEVENIRLAGDSVFIEMAVFNSEFIGKLDGEGRLAGVWHDYSRGDDYAIPFTAEQTDAPRFPSSDQPPLDLVNRYAVGFSVGTPDAYPAIGILKQQDGGEVSGTILTETGDYRYLDGVARGNTIQLSTFDGSHAFLFVGETFGDTLRGTFYSGNHWEEPWMAIPSETAELRNPDELTYLKEGYENIEFSFPNQAGELVSLADERYQDKVVIVQLLGSWCPNCMDETQLFAQWYKDYRDQGLEIIGLAFERIGDESKAKESIEKMKADLGVEYEVLLAATTSDKLVASDALPMLNKVMSFPTSIYIDRQGRIRKIHTGFYGPGTGAPYERFVEQYSDFIEEMLAEGE